MDTPGLFCRRNNFPSFQDIGLTIVSERNIIIIVIVIIYFPFLFRCFASVQIVILKEGVRPRRTTTFRCRCGYPLNRTIPVLSGMRPPVSDAVCARKSAPTLSAYTARTPWRKPVGKLSASTAVNAPTSVLRPASRRPLSIRRSDKRCGTRIRS